MAWQQPSSLLRAVRTACSNCHVSTKPLPSQRWATNIPSARQFSTSPASSAVVAAEPIDFSEAKAINPKLPARLVPDSPSYFTSSPRFTDSLLRLEHLERQHELLPMLPPDQVPRVFWLKLGHYKGRIGERITPSKFNKLVGILQRLNKIHPSVMPKEVKEAIREFIKPGTEARVEAKLPLPDEHGRTKGVGRRKEASARVQLVEGNGQVLINDRNITEIFPRLHDRESVLWPLKVTQRTDKYNVWALSQGGGTTGQAEAITLALAKALVIQEPALKPVLRRAGVMTADARRVERKKPGRVKARKAPQWVKR